MQRIIEETTSRQNVHQSLDPGPSPTTSAFPKFAITTIAALTSPREPIIGLSVVSARQQYAERAICYRSTVCTNVHISVRHRGASAKTVEVKIMKFSPYGSPIFLVFAR